jgi:tetratricopeptide (TPR) repeat protein
LSASAAVAVAALAGTALLVVNNQRANQAASRERLITEFVSEVLHVNQRVGDVAGAGGPTQGLMGDAFLRATAPLVDQRFAEEPAMQAQLYGVVTRLLLDMGAGDPAVDYARKRLTLLEGLGGGEGELFKASLMLAESYQVANRFTEAEEQAKRALELAGKDTARRVDALSMLARATMWLGNNDEAIRLAEEVEYLAKQLTQTPISLAWAHSSRGSAWVSKDDDDHYLVHWAEWHEKGINLALRLQGADSVAAANMRYLYGSQMARQPSVDISKAREVLSACYEARRRIGGTAAVLADVEQPAAWNWLYRRRGASTEEVRAVLERAQRTTASSPLVPDFRRADSKARSNEFEAEFGNLAAAWPTLLEDAERAISSKRSPYQKTLVMWRVAEVARRKGEHAVAGTWLERQRKLGLSAGNGLYPHWMTMADASNLSMAGKSDQALKHFETLPVPTVSGQEEYRSTYRWSLARLLADSGRYAQAIGQLRGELPLLAAAEAASVYSKQVLFGELMCRVGDAELGFDRLDAVLRYSIEDRYPHTPEFAWLRGLMALCALKLGDKARARDLAARAEESFEIQPSVSPYFRRPLDEYRRLTASQKKR